MAFKFHPTQDIVASDKTRYRIVDCGRQWGKTTLAVWDMIFNAYSHSDRRIGYIAPFVSQARDIAWAILKQATEPVWAKPPNETRLELYIKTQDGGISEIVLKGFENIEALRGTQFDFLVLDEVAKMRNFDEGWNAVLQATLLFRHGHALFISTPYGYNHFHKLFLQGEAGNPEYKSYKFSSYDNPHIDRAELQSIKNTTTPDYFHQEYMAEFVRFTGLIYKEFDMTVHVHEFEHEFNQAGDYMLGQDFAVRGWNALLPIWMKPDGHFYILDNYKEEGKTAQQHGEEMKKMLTTYASFEKYSVDYGDPAGFAKNQQGRKGDVDMVWALADEYIDMGFPLVRANNEVTAGINFVRELFRQKKIHIHPRNTKLVDEILQYQWKDQSEKQVGVSDAPELVRKLNDHLIDALRYSLYSKPIAPEEDEAPRKTTFPVSFPAPRIEKEEETDGYTPIDVPSYYD
jgi:hypothetical protein